MEPDALTQYLNVSGTDFTQTSAVVQLQARFTELESFLRAFHERRTIVDGAEYDRLDTALKKTARDVATAQRNARGPMDRLKMLLATRRFLCLDLAQLVARSDPFYETREREFLLTHALARFVDRAGTEARVVLEAMQQLMAERNLLLQEEPLSGTLNNALARLGAKLSQYMRLATLPSAMEAQRGIDALQGQSRIDAVNTLRRLVDAADRAEDIDLSPLLPPSRGQSDSTKERRPSAQRVDAKMEALYKALVEAEAAADRPNAIDLTLRIALLQSYLA